MKVLDLSFVKICGITRVEDAAFACSLGISAIGFVAYPKSKRHISSAGVNEITSRVTKKYPKIKRVGVFVNDNFDTIVTYLKSGINVVQLHGNETAEYIHELKKAVLAENNTVEIWRAARLKTEQDIIILKNYSVDKYLVDSFVKDEIGGTGVVGDWKLAELAVNRLHKPVILAGGLTPDNIHEAVAKVHPFGVDVSSGVEVAPGIKDYNLMKKFIGN
jgi:phosphoribosylanthranilate isomerase